MTSRIVLACMDRRENATVERIIEEYGKGSVSVIRNPGANVRAAEPTIRSILRENNVSEMTVLPHKDCGAVKFALDRISNKSIDINDPVFREFVEPFMNRAYANREEMERANAKMQEDAAVEIRNKDRALRSVNCSLVDVNTSAASNGSHILIIGKSFSGSYEELAKKIGIDLSQTYFIQQDSYAEVKLSADLARKALNVSDVRLLANSGSEYRELNTWRENFVASGLFGAKADIPMIRL